MSGGIGNLGYFTFRGRQYDLKAFDDNGNRNGVLDGDELLALLNDINLGLERDGFDKIELSDINLHDQNKDEQMDEDEFKKWELEDKIKTSTKFTDKLAQIKSDFTGWAARYRSEATDDLNNLVTDFVNWVDFENSSITKMYDDFMGILDTKYQDIHDKYFVKVNKNRIESAVESHLTGQVTVGMDSDEVKRVKQYILDKTRSIMDGHTSDCPVTISANMSDGDIDAAALQIINYLKADLESKPYENIYDEKEVNALVDGFYEVYTPASEGGFGYYEVESLVYPAIDMVEYADSCHIKFSENGTAISADSLIKRIEEHKYSAEKLKDIVDRLADLIQKASSYTNAQLIATNGTGNITLDISNLSVDDSPWLTEDEMKGHIPDAVNAFLNTCQDANYIDKHLNREERNLLVTVLIKYANTSIYLYSISATTS